MQHRIRRALASPISEDDDRTRVAALLNVVLLTVQVVAVINIIASLTLPSVETNITGIVTSGAGFVLAFSMRALMRRGRVELAATLACYGLWVIVTAATIAFGGVRAPIFSGYFMVIVMAGLLLGEQGAIRFVILSILAGLAILYLDLNGFLAPPQHTLTGAWVAQTLLSVLVGVLLYLAAHNINLSWKRTHQHERMLVERNRDLQNEIARRTEAEESLRRVNRAYRVLSECNQVLIRAVDERLLLRDICRTIVEVGSYRLVWIGFAEDDGTRWVRPVASAGHEAGYLDTPLTWDDSEHGRNPTGAAIRTGTPQVVRDMLNAPVDEPWQEEARRRGYASSASLSIRDAERTLGALNVYAAEPDAFGPDEVRLLAELAADIGFGLDALRTREQYRRAEERFRKIFSASPVAISIAPPNGPFLDVNERFLEMLGYERDEVIGRTATDLDMWVSPADRAYFVQSISDEGKIPQQALSLRTKSGAIRDTLVSMEVIDLGGEACALALIHDVTDHRRAEQELLNGQRLRLELQKERELNDMRARFVSMLSHEFRTPLSVVLTSSELVKTYHERISPERQQEHLDNIRVQVKRLTAIVDDILALSQTESVGFTFNPAPVHLSAFCQTIADELQQTTSSHHVIFSNAGEVREISADPKLLRQAFSNLISNAIKYSPEGGAIRVHVGMEQDHAIVSVSDEGMGIPEDDQRRLFEVFYRASNVGGILGTGLGLAIVKRAVELHQGRIEFESQVGVGTTFAIHLPYLSERQTIAEQH